MVPDALSRRPRAVGIALLAVLALLTSASAIANPGSRPAPLLLLLVGVGLTFAGAGLAARDDLLGVVLPLAASVAVAGSVLLAPDGLSGRPLAGPLGYGNANGALCLLGTGAGLLAAARTRWRWSRATGLVVGAICAALAVQTGSMAAAALSGVLLMVGGAHLLAPLPDRPALAVAALLPLGALGLTLVLAAAPTGEGPLVSALSQRRPVLWSESLSLAGGAPLLGVGPGGFARHAPTALADVDAGWSHSLLLQTAAELGVPAATCLLGLLGWWAALAWRRRAVGSALAVGAVLTQAAIDYTAHFPAVVLLTVALAGLGTGRGPVTAAGAPGSRLRPRPGRRPG